MSQEKKNAVLTLCREAQGRFLEGDLSELLSGCMSLAMCGLSSVCKCIDGRTKVGKHLAGAGLLLWHMFGEDYALFIMRKMNLAGICTHEDCGAAKMVAVSRGLDENPNDLACWWGAYAAKKLGIRYFGHFPVGHNFHPETAIVLDGTGQGHWTAATCLPERIVINAKDPNLFYVTSEFLMALEIIYGDSGMGGLLICEKLPLLILVVGDPRPEGIASGRIAELAACTLKSMKDVHQGNPRIREYTPSLRMFPS